ncbi:MAG: hypothetical protein BWY99_02324 [Synergistetes bacterium ADurb.BinA166]|nr:MAG: hypothetical protein BWY99_02324 [Synergistetes bacterium ADurb.BinA166]
MFVMPDPYEIPRPEKLSLPHSENTTAMASFTGSGVYPSSLSIFARTAPWYVVSEPGTSTAAAGTEKLHFSPGRWGSPRTCLIMSAMTCWASISREAISPPDMGLRASRLKMFAVSRALSPMIRSFPSSST